MAMNFDHMMAFEDYDIQQSFTSEFVLAKKPFGDAIRYQTIISEAIWNNFESSSSQRLRSIPVYRGTGEPGPVFDYDALTKMLLKSMDKLPRYVNQMFARLAEARVRYFTGYELYFIQQRARDDVYAERKMLHAKRQEIMAHPELFKENALIENTLAQNRNNKECSSVQERFHVCNEGVLKCSIELFRVKMMTAPYIKRLTQAFQEIFRQHQAFHARNGQIVASNQAGAPGNGHNRGGFCPFSSRRNNAASSVTGYKRPQEQNGDGGTATTPVVDGILNYTRQNRGARR